MGYQCSLSIETLLAMLTSLWTNLHINIQEDYNYSIPFVLTETIGYNGIISYELLLIAPNLINGQACI